MKIVLLIAVVIALSIAAYVYARNSHTMVHKKGPDEYTYQYQQDARYFKIEGTNLVYYPGNGMDSLQLSTDVNPEKKTMSIHAGSAYHLWMKDSYNSAGHTLFEDYQIDYSFPEGRI